jgi:tetratricopeptide (TPR) repeat protein
MKLTHLLALSLGLTIVAFPTRSIAQSTPQPQVIATNRDRLPVPKVKVAPRLTLDGILQSEATWLAQKPSAERTENLGRLIREFQVYLMESKQFDSNVVVPSQATISYFADLMQKYPKSSLIARFHADSVTSEVTDEQKIIAVYDKLIAKYPNDPMLFLSYRDQMLSKYDNLPAAMRTHLSRLQDRAIAQDPQNLSLYIDRARITATSAEAILQQWDATAAKLPTNPAVGEEFSQLLWIGRGDSDPPLDAKVVAAAIERLDAALQRYPKSAELYRAYANLHFQTKTLKKAIPILQAGLAKGADPYLNGIIGAIYLKEGNETQAVSYFQKNLSSNVSGLCKNWQSDVISQFKDPANQRAIVRFLVPALAEKGSSECIATIADIILATPIDKPMSQEIITFLTPIAQSKGDMALSNALLKLIYKQGQFQQITAIGPKLLPANGVELDDYEFMMAESIPFKIAQAYEKLGNWEQAAKFYGLLSDYHKVAYPKSLTDRGISLVTSWHLGNLAWQQGNAAAAIALLQPVVNHSLSHWDGSMGEDNDISYRALAHNLLGEIYQSQGKKAEAKQQFEAAVKMSEKFQTPKDNLAKLK